MPKIASSENSVYIRTTQDSESGCVVEMPGQAALTAGSNSVMTRQELDLQVEIYEQMYAMPSFTFYKKWLQGKAPDTYETNDWATLYEYQQRDYGS